MEQQTAKIKLRVYEAAVTAPGFILWLVALVFLSANYPLRELLIFLALVPLVVTASVFPNVFPLPAGLKFAQEKVTFTPSDSIVLLVACWYGPAPAVFIAGVEGFISSRRAVRRLSSNIFSFGMMSLVGGASSITLGAVLCYGFGETGRPLGHAAPLAPDRRLRPGSGGSGGTGTTRVPARLRTPALPTLRRDDSRARRSRGWSRSADVAALGG